jgi:hypothetical protein
MDLMVHSQRGISARGATSLSDFGLRARRCASTLNRPRDRERCSGRRGAAWFQAFQALAEVRPRCFSFNITTSDRKREHRAARRQSRPKPRGGSTLLSSDRSISHTARNASAVALPSRLGGRVSSQSRFEIVHAPVVGAELLLERRPRDEGGPRRIHPV